MGYRIKGVSTPSPSPLNPTKNNVPSTPTSAPNAASSQVQKELKKSINDLIGYKNSPFSGLKLFSDGVIFPGNILDTSDAKNDPKFARLLAAVYGLAEFERYFDEGSEDDEWKLGKLKAQEERKKEQEKEEEKNKKK